MFVFLVAGLYTKFFQNKLQTEAGYQSPQIFVYGGENSFSAGGLISLASTDEAAVQVGGYNISGSAVIDVYKANKDLLLDYLIHDKEGKQVKSKPDVSKLEFVGTTTHNINTGSYEGSKVPLPLSETGIWYLKVKIGNVNTDAFVLRTGFGVLAKEGDNEFVFWGQDFKTKRSIGSGTISVLNLKDSVSSLYQTDFDNSGLARGNISENADIALAQFGEQLAVVPLNLKYLNVASYKSYVEKARNTNYFVFTDRPLYSPGDKVFFKAVIRNDDDARYTIPSGSAKVKISSGWGEEEFVLEKNYPISPDGTVSGEYSIPADAKLGWYNMQISTGESTTVNWGESHWYNGSVSFDVQFYQKPEYSVDVTTPKTELVAGDMAAFTIEGNYFSGQPMSGQKVKYRVAASDYYDYNYFSDASSLRSAISSEYRYGYYGSHTVLEGTTVLDKNGRKDIEFETKMDFNSGKSQVFTIETTLEDNSQTPSFARRNVLVYAGRYGIYRTDYSYGSKVNTKLDLPVRLYAYDQDASLGNVQLVGKVHWETWEKYTDPNQKYPQYRKVESDLSDIKATTDSSGKAILSFVPEKLGYYRITVQGKDSRDNLIANTFYSYVTDQDQPAFTQGGGEEITVSADKQVYNPGETAKLAIYSKTPDRDVFLSMERGRVNRFQVLHLNDNKSTIDMPVLDTDIPNIFAKVSSFAASALDSNSINIKVSTLSKKVIVDLNFDNKKYAPGDDVNVKVTTKDGLGQPVSADVALWAVDKAIFELSDNTLGDIFENFWNERGNTTQEDHSLEGIVAYSAEGGGCFLPGTKVLMADGSQKNIEDVKKGDLVLTRSSEANDKLVKAKVLSTTKARESGYLTINGTLKVTPNHIIWANGVWREAGSIELGDTLRNSQNQNVLVYSKEWQRYTTDVYNLSVEKYHTYFADGVFVHNQKGDARSTFKDTAYWNPSIKTNASGVANVTFKLPDNLTTWTVAAVANTTDTKVGQTTSEIVVTKDVIVRPILPNIMRLGDNIVISALIQNSTDADKNFDIDLKFDSGEVLSRSFKNVQVGSGSVERFAWEIKPSKESEGSSLEISAKATDNSEAQDTIISKVAVIPFGFFENFAETGEGNKNFKVSLSSNISKTKSDIRLSLSPSILGTLPTAMKYLVNYPYGCTEQITSRFVPAIIAKANQQLFSEALQDKDVNEMIETGVAKLLNSQMGNGGWTWWFTGNADPFITSYVAEYLSYANKLGYKVDKNAMNRVKGYLASKTYYDYKQQKEVSFTDAELTAKNYGLVMLGETKNLSKVNLDNLQPDMLALAVIVNSMSGNKNSATNGLDKLISMAQVQGDTVYWNEGDKVNFGSKDASTAFAIRAIIASGGDRELAVKAARYLVRNRKSDYWSNTFATAQVVRALTDLSKTAGEANPSFLYTVTMDGKELANGQVKNVKDTIEDIVIDPNKINQKGSDIKIVMEGEGQLYSTLVSKLFVTDTKAEPVKNELSIKREYINEKGEEYALAVGDSVVVKLTVTGPQAPERYGAITDELPSGMVPVNPGFKNEQYGESPLPKYFSSSYVTGMDVTQNGAVLSLYTIEPGVSTYTYRARVVSAGKFTVPPATVSLMYAPEIYARTGVQVVTIASESKLIPAAALGVFLKKYVVSIVIAVLGMIGVISLVIKAKKTGFSLANLKTRLAKIFNKKNDHPPITPDVQ